MATQIKAITKGDIVKSLTEREVFRQIIVCIFLGRYKLWMSFNKYYITKLFCKHVITKKQLDICARTRKAKYFLTKTWGAVAYMWHRSSCFAHCPCQS